MSRAREPETKPKQDPGPGLAGLLVQLVAGLPLAVVLGALVLARVLVNLDRFWDGLRLTPVFALVRGYPLYPRIDQGPLLSFCYGPVSALAYLPASLATTPTSALLIASAITLTIGLLPIAWIAFRRGGSGAIGFVAFGFAMLLSPSLSYSLFSPVHDAVALSLGLVSCLLLVSSRDTLSTGQLLASALALALAVWSKQNAVFLAPASFAYLWILRGRLVAFRYAGLVSLCGLVLAVIFSLAFGFEGLKFNLIDIPRRHVAQYGWGQAFAMLSESSWPFLLAVAVAAALGFERLTTRDGWRSNPAGLLLLAALALTPVSLMGVRKQGGGLNSLSFTIDFLAAATVALLASPTCAAGWRKVGLRIVSVTLALGLGIAAWQRGDTLDWKRLRDNPHEQAFRFARQNPGVAYFPWNGLSTILADGHLDHVEDGFVSAEAMAGFEIPDAVVREHLPKAARFIAYPPGFNETSWGHLFMRKYLPGRESRRPVDGLRDWLIFEIRPAPGN